MARLVILQLKTGAQVALLPTTVAPMRLIGAMQQFAPDCVTSVLLNPRLAPGDPFKAVRWLRGGLVPTATTAQTSKSKGA